MASHALINAHVAALRSRRLPTAAIDELADGLTETYDQRLLDGLDPDNAATTAVTEFGTVDEIAEAFGRHAPGHRIAKTLLATGPMVGASWAASFITARAWTWPHARTAALVFAAGLVLTVALLEVARLHYRNYAQTRVTSLIGSINVIGFDTALIATITVAAPVFVWPMILATSASLARIAFTLRVLPPLFTH
jgi:hypothetical protein